MSVPVTVKDVANKNTVKVGRGGVDVTIPVEVKDVLNKNNIEVLGKASDAAAAHIASAVKDAPKKVEAAVDTVADVSVPVTVKNVGNKNTVKVGRDGVDAFIPVTVKDVLNDNDIEILEHAPGSHDGELAAGIANSIGHDLNRLD